MGHRTNNQEFNCIWRLRCDIAKGAYTLTIQYRSELPPQDHQEMHAGIKQQALEWLQGRGIDPGCTHIEITRIPAEDWPDIVGGQEDKEEQSSPDQVADKQRQQHEENPG